jgi:bacterioferritin-associated ferredoxin
MVVCSCNFIREQQIRDVARTGILDVEDIYEHLGCRPNCCQCLGFAEQIISDEMRRAA